MDYSPLLAVLTGMFEVGAAVSAFVSPGRKRILFPVGLLLLLLAVYQFAEVAVCSNPSNILLSRIAFSVITWLPALSLWILYQLAGPGGRGYRFISLAWFAAGTVFFVWIMADSSCITKSVCETVIARYLSPDPFDLAYAIFYQSGLAVLVFASSAALVRAEDRVSRAHIANLQAGVLGFMVPAMAVRLLVDGPGGILPSVMCHFALILAVSLTFLIARERRLLSSGPL